MLTAVDKAIASLIVPVLAYVNQKYGMHIDTDPATLTIVVGFLSTILVYFVPNKEVKK